MREYAIDLSGVTAREDLHQRLREALPLPEWYGDNLDALYDALTDMEDPAIISVSGWESLQKALPSYFISFARVLEDASAQTEGLFVSFETEKEPENEVFEEADDEETDEEGSGESGEEADKAAETQKSEESGTEADENSPADEEDRVYEEAEPAMEADQEPEDVEEEV